MAEGLPDDGLLVACELEPYLKEFAQPVFDKSPHGKKIVVKTGSAMDTLKARWSWWMFNIVFHVSGYMLYSHSSLSTREILCKFKYLMGSPREVQQIKPKPDFIF